MDERTPLGAAEHLGLVYHIVERGMGMARYPKLLVHVTHQEIGLVDEVQVFVTARMQSLVDGLQRRRNVCGKHVITGIIS